MNLWNILYTVLDWVFHWRFNLCFWGGLVFAILVASSIAHEPLRWIAAGAALIACVIVGWRWDNAS